MDEQSQALAKLLQGAVTGMLMGSQGQLPLAVTKIDVPTDADGNYKDYIEVTVRSGRKIHILFTSFTAEEQT